MALNICVLRSGGEYRPEHVRALARRIPKLVCLSDVPIPGVQTITMLHDWQGWWCKMELFRPDIYGDMFYLDLDTVVVGDIERLASAGRTTMLSDFYFPERPASGLMYLSAADRDIVWQEWIKDPAGHMARCGSLGDQKLIGDCLPHAARWQDDYPRRRDQLQGPRLHQAAGHARPGQRPAAGRRDDRMLPWPAPPVGHQSRLGAELWLTQSSSASPA
ncbi:hypothetical protein BAY1663_02347 [Pseudomonas sp. BAY1663]|uniref:hypothetical protein n=1 Tax=Pseudomonas sp. BAY1663 TaxID=1439940 RepID=UPI00042E160D|nr:hypothetical protein [Pseudomonas sp. BAY1663]EXF45268.1 hypothetical protein BAY1663_02347 [Pseudomonas sp. BAY1663]